MVTAALALAIPLHAFQAEPAFEVVAIRRNVSGEGGGGIAQGRRYQVRNQTVTGVLMGAFLIPPERIIGLPGWTMTERYDINAQAERDFGAGELPAMLRSLLRDRFGFVGRTETRDLAAYALVLARADGRLGPRLRPAAIDCRDAAAVKAARAAASGQPVCSGDARQTRLIFRGLGLRALAQALATPAGRPVIDRTALTGTFDIDLEWAAIGNPDGVAIFTAVQDQLGLRLEDTTAPFQVLVVENIQRPTEN